MSQATRDNLIIVGILLAALLGAAVLVYLPQRRQLQDLQSRIASQKLHLIDTAKKTSTVPHMVRQVEGMKKRYSNFDRRLPKRIELGGFLREISNNLSKERLSNQLIEPSSPSRAELFHTLPIILRFEGSYPALASFLKRLDRMERLTQVQKLLIHSNTRGGQVDSDSLSIELLMNIYFTES